MWCHNIKEVDCLAARRPHEKQSGDYYVPIFGRLFGAQSATIRGLGGNDVPLHRVWEYRDIGRLFITVGGESVIIRGVLGWGWWR